MQAHPAHHFERELDAMLANVNNSQLPVTLPVTVKHEVTNDNGKQSQPWITLDDSALIHV
jgi:hypothetical protein